MEYALEERIGKPELFTGRKEELSFFLNWIKEIKEKKSQSTAILARRKMGKTALMERLFNITFHRNDNVIPFYYEVKERDIWIGDFCVDFFLTFIYQYIAFKTRKAKYVNILEKNDLEKAKRNAAAEGLDYIVDSIESVENMYNRGQVDLLWETVRIAPHNIAVRNKEFIVQMIDEFQFINATVFWDKAKTKEQRAKNLAGGYLSTAESKNAPLLVTGSWVGWLMNELITLLPGRFVFYFLRNMPEEEAYEMVYKYSQFFDVPVSEETVYAMAEYTEGSPFYISSIFRSIYNQKDLTTIKGLMDILEYETLDEQGRIKSTWMEYMDSALPRVNDRNAKNIVLYLCKNRDREVTRRELMEELKLDMNETELEKRLKALVKADIINRGSTNFRYSGVSDNIFDKVFRGVYEEEIREFDVAEIAKEYKEDFGKLYKKYHRLLGKYNYQKGYFAEYLILDQLRLRVRKQDVFFKSITQNLPSDFQFCEYSRVWRYDSSPEYTRSFNIDIFARALSAADYTIIGEVKSRDRKKFSKEEAVDFERKFNEIKKLENIERALGFIFSTSGFTKEAEAYCLERGFAYSQDERWLSMPPGSPDQEES